MQKPIAFIDRQSKWIVGAGLLFVAARNWYAWRHDRERLLHRSALSLNRRVVQATARISVLVAAWNEEDIVKDHVQSFLRLRYPNKELVICAGGTDNTYSIAKCFDSGEVIVLQQHAGEGKQQALRRCLEKATGDVVFLTDADSLLDDSSFEATLAPILEDGESASSGTCRPLPDQEHDPLVAYQWLIQFYSYLLSGQYSQGFQGCNAAITRGALEACGGFRDSVSVGTDYHLARQVHRMGYRIRMVPESAIPTRFPERADSYLRRQSRWLRNLFLHGFTRDDRRDVVHAMLTWSIGIAALTLSAMSIPRIPVARICWLWVLGFSLVTRVRYFLIAREAGLSVPTTTLTMLPAFVYLDWLAWTRSLLDTILTSRRGKW